MKYLFALFLLLCFISPAWAPPIRSQFCDATHCEIQTQNLGLVTFTIITVGVTTTITFFQDGIQQGSPVIANNLTCPQLIQIISGDPPIFGQQSAGLIFISQMKFTIACTSVNPLVISPVSSNL